MNADRPDSPRDARGPVIVLGDRGLLGQALRRVCGARGLRVVGLSRTSGVDLADTPDLERLLSPHAPALVVNAAAITNLADCERQPAQAYALHAELPARLAAWSARHGVPWVQVSTDHYFCGHENTLHDESAAVQLVNTYARSKYAGEQAALDSPRALVLRTNIVGLRGWPGAPTFAEWAIATLQAPQAFALYHDVWASSLEAGQFADALLDLQALEARGLWNVAARESVSKADFVQALAKACGLSAAHARITPRDPQAQPRRANAMGLNVRHAEARLGRPLPDTRDVVHALRDAWRAQAGAAALAAA